MGLYSYLEAINHMLLSSGEHLVSNLNDEAGVDTSVAQFVLNQTIKATMMRGVANNRYVTTIAADNSGKINLPTDACYVTTIEPLFDPTTGEVIQTSIKSGPNRLFNINKQTDVFTQLELELEVIVLLGNSGTNYGWDDIESSLQRGIMESSAREYQVITQGDLDLDKRMAVKEQMHMARGRAADINKKNRNIFWSGDVGARAAVNRRGILSNDPYFTRTRF
jgi:hypothetical protein